MTSQYGAYALCAGLARDMHVCACTRPRAREPTRTHARTSAHTHTDHYVTLIAFPQQQWFMNASQCYVIRTLSLFLMFKYQCSLWELTKHTAGKMKSLNIKARGAYTYHCNLNGIFFCIPTLYLTQKERYSNTRKRIKHDISIMPGNLTFSTDLLGTFRF
jgi:hypothetical protein